MNARSTEQASVQPGFFFVLLAVRSHASHTTAYIDAAEQPRMRPLAGYGHDEAFKLRVVPTTAVVNLEGTAVHRPRFAVHVPHFRAAIPDAPASKTSAGPPVSVLF